MADEALKLKIRKTLESGYFGGPEDAVSVSDSEDVAENVHVVVVSPKFRGKRLGEKTELIMSELYQALPTEDWEHVSLSIGISPEELKCL